jgi:hypothetical protein
MKDGRDFDEIEEGVNNRLYTLEELLSEVEVEKSGIKERTISEDERDDLLRETHKKLLTEDERDELVRGVNESSGTQHSVPDDHPILTAIDLDPEEVYRLYYGEKLSQRKVAGVLGHSRDEIQALFRTQGWESRSVGGVKKDIDSQEVYRICIEEGRPKKEAAETLGCMSTIPITRILKENGWKTPLEVKTEAEIDPDEAHRLHFEEGWSFIRIANHYGYASKDIISKLFKEREWTPIPITRRAVYEFPSEITDEHQIESSCISDAFEQLRDLEIISPLDVARFIEHVLSISPSESRVRWIDFPSRFKLNARVVEVLENQRAEVETSLNELLGISESSRLRTRIGFVDEKLYIRYQDTSEYNWLNIYENELFYFRSADEKFRLVHEMRARLGLETNTSLGRLIDQLTDRETPDSNGYSDIREHKEAYLRSETLHLILDTTGQTLSDIQDMIECIGKIRGGKYEGKGGVRNPRFPTDPEVIDMMFARFFGLGLSDGHLDVIHSYFVYAEKDRDRRGIVIQHSKDFGDVYYHEKEVNGEVRQIQFASAFGRALKKRGFPVGDKCFLNADLPDFIKNGSLQTICVYFSNMWPEDGCFTIEYPRHIGLFIWGRSVIVRDPTKEVQYNFKSETTDDHLLLFKEYGKYREEDSKNGFKGQIHLTLKTLDELTQSENPSVSSPAKELKEIVLSNQCRLLDDEIAALRRIGIQSVRKSTTLVYHVESSRVSISRKGIIYRKKDVMKTGLIMPPDDIHKRAKLEKWMSFHPELRKQVERELVDLGLRDENNSEQY